MYVVQGRYAEAERLYKRSLEIQERVLGGDHPDVALLLNKKASLLERQVMVEGQNEEVMDTFGSSARCNASQCLIIQCFLDCGCSVALALIPRAPHRRRRLCINSCGHLSLTKD